MIRSKTLPVQSCQTAASGARVKPCSIVRAPRLVHSSGKCGSGPRNGSADRVVGLPATRVDPALRFWLRHFFRSCRRSSCRSLFSLWISASFAKELAEVGCVFDPNNLSLEFWSHGTNKLVASLKT
jgi:hypothetical protein